MNQLKRLALTPLVVWKHGTVAPRKIKLGPGHTNVHINPADKRAYKKLVVDIARWRESTPMRFWREHAAIHPDATMIDIGSNYGECIFNPQYQQQTCIAVEANPQLCEFLNRSRDDHQHAENIRIVNTLLGAQQADDVPFYFVPEWTGGGSGVVPEFEGATVVQVGQRTLDDVLAENNVDSSHPLIFKMDVEGFEAKVFQGFQTMENFSDRLGILEFDTEMIQRSGESAEQLFQHLIQSHRVFLSRLRSRRLIEIDSWRSLQQRYNRPFHCDLVVTTSADLFTPRWRAAIVSAKKKQAA